MMLLYFLKDLPAGAVFTAKLLFRGKEKNEKNNSNIYVFIALKILPRRWNNCLI